MNDDDPDLPARLRALQAYQILDTPPEEGFDDLVALAAHICKTPIALVSLVEETRQWFKAKVGLEACETPIGQAVCAYAIRQQDLLIIPDLTQDLRTLANPLVTGEAHMRFYAGAPLLNPQGVAIGTICCIDTVARPFGLNEEQQQMLRRLAGQVMAQLELRRLLAQQTKIAADDRRRATQQLSATRSENASLRETGERWRAAEAAGRIGTFEIDIATNDLIASEEFCRIFGFTSGQPYKASDVETLLVRDNGWSTASNRQTRADASAPLEVTYRIRRASDHHLRWIARRADFRFGPDGAPTSMLGTVQDITDVKRLQTQQEALLTLGDRLRDAAGVEMAEASAADLLGRTLAASRAGYARLSREQERYEIVKDWKAEGIGSLIGDHPTQAFDKILDQLKLGQTVTISNVAAADWLGEGRDAFRAMNVASQIVVPVFDKGTLIGVVYVHQAEARTWNEDEVTFAQGVADRLDAALAKLRAEAEQRVLNLELSHRLKNTLTMVQAIAGQTLRGADQTLVKAFELRIAALSSAHEVLLRQNWLAVPARTIVEAVLPTLSDLTNFEIIGPDLVMGPRATLAFSLILHELSTNALKYGSLSQPGGKVILSWRIEDGETEAIFAFDWCEVGGPPVKAPSQKGFGSRLVRMGLLGTGDADLGYKPDGFCATMRASLQQLQQI